MDIKQLQIKLAKDDQTGGANTEKSWLQKDISFGSGAWNDKSKEQLYNTILTLLVAGLDLYSTMDLAKEEQKKKKLRAELADVQNCIGQGDTLSEALGRNRNFTTYEVQSIRLGEESGDLTVVLEQLIKFYKNRMAIKKLLVRALAYPLFVLGISIVVIWFMLSYVVPIFADVFSRFDAEIPAITQWVIKLSGTVSQITPWLVLGMIVLFVVLRSQRNKMWFRRFKGQVISRIPWFGPLIEQVYLTRFAQSMGLLLKTGTPLVQALAYTEKMIDYYPLETALARSKEKIEKGASLNACLKQEGIFQQRMVSLVKVAEEVNQLDAMMYRLANQMEDEVNHKTSMIGSILEPVLIVFIAIFVAIVLVSMYLPLFELSNVIGS